MKAARRRHSTAALASVQSYRSAKPARARLLALQHDHGRTYVNFICGETRHVLSCKPGDLRSFKKFRRRVASELGLQIDHHSDDLTTFAERDLAWKLAVREAETVGTRLR